MKLIAALALASFVTAPPQTKTPQEPAAGKLAPKAAAALKQLKLAHEKISDDFWVVTLKDKEDDLDVRAYDTTVVVSKTVELGSTLPAESMRALLEANLEATSAKVSLAGDDLVTLSVLPADFTPSMLRAAIDEVMQLSNEGAAIANAPDRNVPTEEWPTVAPAKGIAVPLVRGAFQITYDPAKWTPQKSDDPTATQFNHVSGDAYAKVIGERIEIEAESFPEIILMNARQFDSNMQLLSQTPRIVNKLPVILLRYGGSTKGIKLVFLNQAYSDKAGSVQIVGWTGSNLLDEYKQDILELFASFRKR